MKNVYGKMLDDVFSPYYERFRELGALSKETAVTKAELFPEGQSLLDPDRMHKMLSAGIVKRAGANRYWLNEKMASNPNAVLKQRLMVILAAIIFAAVILILQKYGIIGQF